MLIIKYVIQIGLFLLIFSSHLLASGISYKGIDIPDQSGKVVTVLGFIKPEALGPTLMHEHLFLDFNIFPLDKPERWPSWQSPPATEREWQVWNEKLTASNRSRLLAAYAKNRDARTLDNMEEMAREVRAYLKLGGHSIVEVTPTLGLRRSAPKLKQLAQKTGAHIIMGTGVYRTTYHPSDMSSRTVEDITTMMVTELVKGESTLGIRAGIIGEIPAVDLTRDPLDSAEVRVLRAAARSSRLTGAAITLHSNMTQPETWHSALDILEQEGADLSRVVVGHMLGNVIENMDIVERLIRRGAYIQFDLFGCHFANIFCDSYRAEEALYRLIEKGYSDHLLVSQDVYTKYQLTQYGGHGYTYIHRFLIPNLYQRGVSEESINRIMVINPMKVLTFSSPKKMLIK